MQLKKDESLVLVQSVIQTIGIGISIGIGIGIHRVTGAAKKGQERGWCRV